jgi:hypothetical protein
MNENKEIIARALETAITLAGAEKSQVYMDSEGNAFLGENLYSKMKTVIHILCSKNFDNIVEEAKRKTLWAYADKRLDR